MRIQPAPATVSRVRRLRLTRDLIVVGTGFALLVFGLIAAHGQTPVYFLACVMIVLWSIAAYLHRKGGIQQPWTPGTRAALSVIGLLLAAFGLVYALSAFGRLGQQASGPATGCEFVPAHTASGVTHVYSTSAHYACSVRIRWPDGTSPTYPVSLATGDGTLTTVSRPPAIMRGFIATGIGLPWATGVAYLVAALLLAAQAVVSLGGLATERRRRCTPRSRPRQPLSPATPGRSAGPTGRPTSRTGPPTDRSV